MQVCHKCDTPGCVNPDHLFLGTWDDNMNDMRQKRRDRVPRIGNRGARNANAKLTHDQASEILALARAGVSYSQIAATYGTSKTNVRDIKIGKAWAHLQSTDILPEASHK